MVVFISFIIVSRPPPRWHFPISQIKLLCVRTVSAWDNQHPSWYLSLFLFQPGKGFVLLFPLVLGLEPFLFFFLLSRDHDTASQVPCFFLFHLCHKSPRQRRIFFFFTSKRRKVKNFFFLCGGNWVLFPRRIPKVRLQVYLFLGRPRIFSFPPFTHHRFPNSSSPRRRRKRRTRAKRAAVSSMVWIFPPPRPRPPPPSP